MNDKRLDIDYKIKVARLFCKGAIFEVEDSSQAKVAQRAGARGVMPTVVFKKTKKANLATMPDPRLISDIYDSVALPVFGRVRIGHTVEAQIMEESGAAIIDESEQLCAASSGTEYIDKTKFVAPFCCGANTLGEVVNALSKGAAMIRVYGSSNGNAVEIAAVLANIKKSMVEVKTLIDTNNSESSSKIDKMAKKWNVKRASLEALAKLDKIPVPIFASSFNATPADAALMMQKGFDGVFIGPEVFHNNENPLKYANSICKAVASYNKPSVLAEISFDLNVKAS